MRSVTVRLDDLRTMILNLGYVGENEHRTFNFDCKKMFGEYPSASVSLTVQPPAGDCYLATVERNGDLVSWTVTDSDLIEEGCGEIQLTFMVGEVVAKTCIGRTKVERSLGATGDIPTPIENWIEQAEEVISEAEAATAAAEGAAEHQPIIDDNGYWAVWDADAEEYVATEYKAQGTDGHDGVGIVSIEKTGTSGLVDTYTITFTSGNPVTYTVTNGRDADPAELIDDTAGSGDTDKVWSADKSAAENLSLLTEINSKVNTSLMKKCELIYIEESANKWDKDSASVGLVHTNGNVYTGSSYDIYMYSHKIAVESGDVLYLYASYNGYIQSVRVVRVAAYDENNEVVPASGSTEADYYTVPNGIKSVIVTIMKDYNNTSMLLFNDSTVPSEYIPYREADSYYLAKSDFVPSSVYIDDTAGDGNTGKTWSAHKLFSEFGNVWPADKSEEKNNSIVAKLELVTDGSKNKWDKESAKVGLVHTNGNVYTGGSYDIYMYSPQITVQSGNVLYLYANYTGTIQAVRFVRIAAYDENGDVVPASGTTETNTYTVPVGIKSIIVTIARDYNNTSMLFVNDANVPAEYVPYTKPYYVASDDFVPSQIITQYIPNSVKEYVSNKATSEFAPMSVGSPNRVSTDEQYERANFIFFSDSHIDYPASRSAYSLENVNDLVGFANESQISFDAIIHGGDVITDGGIITKSSWINKMKPFFDAMKSSIKPVIFTIGNHDTNDWQNIPANVMDDTAWGDAWLNYAESNMGIVRQTKGNGHKSTWHYKDITDKKIRIISVDTQDTDKSVTDGSGNVLYHGGSSWYISQEQMDWIVETALNFDEKDDTGWGVIIVLHQTMQFNDVYYSTTREPAYDSAIQKLVKVCQAFNTQDTYESSYTFATDSFYDLNIDADFTRYSSEEHKPYMICMLVGHQHTDYVKTVDGIKMIWIGNGSCTNEYSDSRLARIPGTATQNLFNLVSVDTAERKIRVVRYGAGKNCFGSEPYSFMPDGLSF